MRVPFTLLALVVLVQLAGNGRRMMSLITLGATGSPWSPRAAPGSLLVTSTVFVHAIQAASKSGRGPGGPHWRSERARIDDRARGQDGLINCAGYIADCDAFVGLVDRLVTGVDSLPAAEQPVCWFLGGAALLDLGPSGLRGVDLPKAGSTYWPHRVNFERLRPPRLDWRRPSRADGR